MKLFISYRRIDSTHAAARVRMSLQQKFGSEAVFIDREIPPGQQWDDYLASMLEQCTGVVVLVGDEFVRKLRTGPDQPGEEPDPVVWEISTAIRLRKPIYPVLFGGIDMPDAARLPEAIREFTRYQAVFAREPAFDSAMAVLIKSIAEAHDWVDPAPAVPPPPGSSTGRVLNRALGVPALVLLAFALLWWAGRMILWMADAASAAARPVESAFWHGTRYALATVLWGLGPYLAYWLVAELRTRARLPIFNLHGLLSVVNLAGILVSGGTFLLMSTLPGWHLVPWFVFPPEPGPLHYAALALGLLGIVVVAVAVAVWEPRVRTLAGGRRVWGMRLVHVTSLLLVLCGLWFAASLANSLPPLGTLDPVPVVGYLMLCPALSLLVGGWQYGQSLLGLRERSWQIRCLFYLVVGLYVACTLALFAHGPTRLLAPAY